MTYPTLSEKVKEILISYKHFAKTDFQAHQAIMEAIRESVPSIGMRETFDKSNSSLWGLKYMEKIHDKVDGWDACREEMLRRYQ